METRDIAVDFDVHKKIETERRSFDETDNDVLRRLLGLPEILAPVSRDSVPEKHGKSQFRQISPRSWLGKGVELPEGTELLFDYPGVSASGEIRNGTWLVEGETYRSPSSAACGIVSKHRKRKMSVNGWMYWRVKRPNIDTEWVPIHSLRDRVDRRSRRRW